MTTRKNAKTLRWGYSTGACAAAVATAAWERLTRDDAPASIRLRFLDGNDRILPLAEPSSSRIAAIRKDAGDDPDCTHNAVIYANIRPCAPGEAGAEDYTLDIGGGVVILRGAEGVGLCTRPGLDCEQGRWAINTGPRRMIAENLRRAGLDAGCWLLEIGVENGQGLAKRTLNTHLGVQGGISLLGTSGLVRPYSHDAYIHTVRICVKSHHLSGGSTMVFCTGGRTKSGAKKRLRELPETAFVCIGDFIAESLAAARQREMREIIVACMPGKLCKYAAGFDNTHAHKVRQDMDLLRAEVRNALPEQTALHHALERSVSVREALLFFSEADLADLLRRLARAALEQFARRCAGGPVLRLLVFDFEGRFLFEEAKETSAALGSGNAHDGKTALVEKQGPAHADGADNDEAPPLLADPSEIVGTTYFLQGPSPNEANRQKAHRGAGRVDVLSCGAGFPTGEDTARLLEEADAVYGSKSLLEACPFPVQTARIIGAKAREDAADAIARCRAGQRVVALASGDALYHGFGGTLASLREEGDNIVYHPGVTAFQELFHRLGLPWQDARLFSAHSGDRLPARDIAEAPLSVTYAGSRYTADAIARAVLAVHPSSARRGAVLAERLGSDEERILSGALEEIAAVPCGPVSILLIFPHSHNGPPPRGETAPRNPSIPSAGGSPAPPPVLALGLPEEEYEKENNLITASDVRAVILSRLRLPAWGTLWDIGAGSGSVGLEAAALRPNLNVHAVERNAERCGIIERNRLRMGVANYTLHSEDALKATHDTGPEFEAECCPRGPRSTLPAPDRVFLGGGGKDLPALLTACMARLRPGGLIVASAVTLESFAALLAWSPEHRTGLCRLDVANERPIAGTSRHMKHQNTIHVFTFRKETTA